MSARSRLQRLERATAGEPEHWFVATEEVAAAIREQARREGRSAPDCLVTGDPLADPPIRVTLTHEQALGFIWHPETAASLSDDQRRELAVRRPYAPHKLTAGFLAWLDSIGEKTGPGDSP
jgi:hypothetical protein